MIEFGLWAECSDLSAKDAFAQHFRGLTHTLLNGRSIAWTVEDQGKPATLGVEVWCADISRSGIRTVADAIEVSEAGLRLIHHLLSAPGFLFARLDWQAPSIQLAEIGEHVCTYPDGSRGMYETCVMHDSVYDRLGAITGFQSFRPGYVWRPYLGERYEPVGSNDHPELFELMRELQM